MLKSPLMLRWRRAQRIDLKDVVVQSLCQPKEGCIETEAWVKSSQSSELGYRVDLTFKNNRIAEASCSCPDFNKKMRGRGVPLLHGVRVCKHCLAAAIKVRRQLDLDLLALVMYLTGWEWEMEFGGGAWVHRPL